MPKPSDGGYPTAHPGSRASSTYKFVQKSGMEGSSSKTPMGDYVWLGVDAGYGGAGKGHSNDRDDMAARTPDVHQLAEKTQAYQLIYGWDPAKVAAFQKMQDLPATGVVSTATINLWSKIVDSAAGYYAAGKKISPEALAGLVFDPKKGRGGGGGPGSPGGGPLTTRSTNLTNRGEAKRLLDELFKDKLGRGVNESEVSGFLSKLNSAQRANPSVTTQKMNADGSVATSSTTGGMDPVQFGQDYVMSQKGGEVNARTVGVDYLQMALGALGPAV